MQELGSTRDDVFDEIPMDTMVIGQFRVERRSHELALAYEDRRRPMTGEDLDAFTHVVNDGCPDEHHFQRLFPESGTGLKAHVALSLAAVSVSFNGDVEQLERGLRWRGYFFREKDGSCTGPVKCTAPLEEVPDRFHEGLADHEFDHSCTFSARQDEAVQSIELLGMFHEARGNTESPERLLMLGVVPLKSQNSYIYLH